MKFLSCLALGLALAFSCPAFAEDLKAPKIPDGEIRVFKSYFATENDRPDMDDPMVKALISFSPSGYTSEVRWKGEGDDRVLVFNRVAKLMNGAEARYVFTFDTKPKFRLKSCKNTMLAPDGTKLEDSYYDFTNPALRYPDRTFHMVVGNMVIQGSELHVGKVIPFTVWLGPTMVFPFQFEVVGEETITTEAGTFECYKVEGNIVTSGLMDITGMILKLSLGSYQFWVEKGGSQGFVRLRWPMSSGLFPGSHKYQTQDLVEIRQGK